jgi:hypothetical protein
MVCCIASLSAPNCAADLREGREDGVDRERPEHRQPAQDQGQPAIGGTHWLGHRCILRSRRRGPVKCGGCILPRHGGRSARAFGPAALPKAQPPGIAQARDRRVTTLWRDRQHRTMRGRRRRGKTCVATLPGPRRFKLSGERTERGEQGFRAAQAASLRAPMRLQAHGQGLTSTLSAIFPSPSP